MTAPDLERFPFVIAGENGHLDTAMALLQHPYVDVNSADMRLRTPMHWAATYNHADAIQLLIHKGARREHRDIYDRTAIDLAVAKGNVEAVIALNAPAAAIEAAQETRKEDTEAQEHTVTMTALEELLAAFGKVTVIEAKKAAQFQMGVQVGSGGCCVVS